MKYRGNDVKPEWAGRGVEAIALLARAELRTPIAVDEAARIARLTADPRPSNDETDACYWIENAPDALDSAGQWYLDRAARTPKLGSCHPTMGRLNIVSGNLGSSCIPSKSMG